MRLLANNDLGNNDVYLAIYPFAASKLTFSSDKLSTALNIMSLLTIAFSSTLLISPSGR